MKLDDPLNQDERYLYGINIRLNILIEMFSSFLDVYGKNANIATTTTEVDNAKIDIEKDIKNESIVEFEKIDYSTLNKSEIINILKSLNIEFDNKMTKTELAKLLK